MTTEIKDDLDARMLCTLRAMARQRGDDPTTVELDLLEISAERFNSSVGRLTSNSIDGLQALVSELQRMQEFLNSEVDKVQRQIDSALAGINIIVETIGPWKSIAGSQTLPSDTRNVRAGGPAANYEQRRVG
jgi:hypothetical protein